ncbi:MAG: NUDIX domain-containing protein [Patescibacteria group bacterium]
MDKIFGIATKAIIRNADNKFLVIFKSETEDVNPNEIDIPGGRLKFGEDIEAGLRREVEEELGIEIEILKPSRVWSLLKDDLHLVGITFLANYVSGEIKLSGEHTNHQWIEKDAIMTGDYPKWIKKEFGEIA